MSIPTPPFIPQPFANNADVDHKNTIPNTTGTPGLASYDLGFPPDTMQPVVSGGVPPFGQDVNGILNEISAHTYSQQAGQLYRFSSDVSTAIGGYPLGVTLESTDGVTVWFNIVDGNTSDPDANGAGWVPLFNYGYTTKSGLTGGTVTLTRLEARRGVIILAGTLVSNLAIVLPATLQTWLIVNTTTGGFTTTVRTAGGSGVIVPQGGFNGPVGVFGDGINIFPTVAPLSIPIDQAATPLSIAQRTNTGYLLAVYFNQLSGVENPTVGSVFVQNDAADGYLRKISLANLESQMLLSAIGGKVTAGQVPEAAVTQYTPQILANAALTGIPTTPTAAIGDNDTTVASTAFVNAQGIGGAGYVWTDQSGFRGINTNYTNDTGRPIQVNILLNLTAGQNASLEVTPPAIAVANGGTATAQIAITLSAIIPPGAIYALLTGTGVTGLVWLELGR